MKNNAAVGFKKNISLFIFLFTGFVFSYKYMSRYTAYALPISLLLAVFQLLLWKKRELLQKIRINPTVISIAIIVSVCFFSVFLFKKVPVETLKIDRWSVTTSFWDNFFTDKYVYAARSFDNNHPGPMPFYFVLALPFYLFGELGYLTLFGILVFYLILRYSGISAFTTAVGLLLLTSSSFFWYEIACRSNIWLFSTLVIATAVLFFNQNKPLKITAFLLCAIVTGLMLSTRNVYAVPYIVIYLYAFRAKMLKFKQLILFGVIAITVFAATFIPFVIGHIEEFKQINPFIIQSTHLIPFEYTVGFIICSISAPFLCKSISDVYFYSGLFLFLIIVVYFGYHFVHSGFYETFYNSAADVTYFIMALPFALYHLLMIDKKQPILPPV